MARLCRRVSPSSLFLDEKEAEGVMLSPLRDLVAGMAKLEGLGRSLSAENFSTKLSFRFCNNDT